MSDTSQGPDWWLASDGKWYPPQSAPQAPPPPGPPAQGQAGKPAAKRRGCLTAIAIVVALIVVIVIISVASGGGGKSASVTGKVTTVGALSPNEVRVYILWTNNGKAAGSASCILNTTVHNQFGDVVNTRTNTTETNGDVKAGSTQLLYQDIGVDNGDAQYVKAKDITITNC